jgi:hypothetical protein
MVAPPAEMPVSAARDGAVKITQAGYTSPMRIRAQDDVAAAVRERGGRVYVWTSAHRCCTGPLVYLEAGAEPPEGQARPFRVYDAGGYEVHLDMGGQRLPDELVLELRGRRRKVVAFWNDQAWVG